MLRRLGRLLRYDAWANAEALTAAGTVAAGEARRLMAHVVAAEWLWLARLRRQPQPAPVWPDWNGDESARRAGAIAAEWGSYLSSLDEPALAQRVPYVNSKGEAWESSVEDVLMHVVLHGAYHRGQAARAVREAGGTPAYTDYVHARRQRLID